MGFFFIFGIGIFSLFHVNLSCAEIRTVAVIPFSNLAADKELEQIGEGITDALLTELSSIRRVEGIRFVERVQLTEAIKELELNLSGLVDPSTAQRVGRFVGADTIIIGAVQLLAGRVSVTARLVQVETGVILQSAHADGQMNEIFNLQKSIAENLTYFLTRQTPLRITYPSSGDSRWTGQIRGVGGVVGFKLKVFIATNQEYYQGDAIVEPDGTWVREETWPTWGLQNRLIARVVDSRDQVIAESNIVPVIPRR